MNQSISYKSPEPLNLRELSEYLLGLLATGVPVDAEVRVKTYMRGTNSNGSLIKRITVGTDV